MPSASALSVFALASLVLVVIPGPSVLYIVARGASQGPRAGFISAVGVQTGSLVHIGAAVFGLSAIISASATAFTIVKVAGGAYLIYLGVQAWRAGGRTDGADRQRETRSAWRLYRDGVIVNVLNPKTAVFFLAFLPQFVDPERGAASGQLLVFGMVFVVVGLLSDSAYGVASGLVGDRLRRRFSRGGGRLAPRLSGALYAGLGVATLASGSRVSAAT